MTIALVIAVLIAALLVYAATRPDRFRIQREARIDAPPDTVYRLLSDFQTWKTWSPWEGLDPNLKRSYSGAPAGVGAVYEWEGNRKVGAGRMEITGAVPASSVTIKLDFLRPFEAHNTTLFTLEPTGGATRLVWAMDGRNAFMNKLMGVFMNFDKMIGKDFEKGLANLQAAAER